MLGHAFLASVQLWFIAHGIIMLVGVFSILALNLIARHHSDVVYAISALKLVKTLLGNKLGPKADSVFAIWGDGLKHIEDGNYTKEEMATEFVSFIKVAMGGNLSTFEMQAVQQAAEVTIDLMDNKKLPTTKALKALSI